MYTGRGQVRLGASLGPHPSHWPLHLVDPHTGQGVGDCLAASRHNPSKSLGILLSFPGNDVDTADGGGIGEGGSADECLTPRGEGGSPLGVFAPACGLVDVLELAVGELLTDDEGLLWGDPSSFMIRWKALTRYTAQARDCLADRRFSHG